MFPTNVKMCSDRMNWGIYFGYCYGDGDYRLYAKQVADSGPGSRLATTRCRRRRLPPAGGGLLRWQGGVSQYDVYS